MSIEQKVNKVGNYKKLEDQLYDKDIIPSIDEFFELFSGNRKVSLIVKNSEGEYRYEIEENSAWEKERSDD